MPVICLHQNKSKKMKTIIIPTDLSLNSLDLVKNAVLHFKHAKIKSEIVPINTLLKKDLSNET